MMKEEAICMTHGAELRGCGWMNGSGYHSSDDTLSVSPFGLPALPEGEPRALRAVQQKGM